jgi:hypothetical protein
MGRGRLTSRVDAVESVTSDPIACRGKGASDVPLKRSTELRSTGCGNCAILACTKYGVITLSDGDGLDRITMAKLSYSVPTCMYTVTTK